MEATTIAPPEPESAVDYWFAMLEPLDGILPVLEGALHSACSTFCDKRNERLTEEGHEFLGIVYGRLVAALKATDRVAYFSGPNDVDFPEGFADKSLEAHRLIQAAVLMGRGLMASDLPEGASAHESLDRIREKAAAALAIAANRAALRPLGNTGERPQLQLVD